MTRSYSLDPVRETEQPLRSEPPERRYFLCSTPRCGSHLIGEYLRQTGVGGDPLEYFHPDKITRYHALSGLPEGDFAAYIRDIELRRTTPNGVFGVKAHHAQFARALKAQTKWAVEYLKGCDAVFLLRRRDKVAQAVSYYKAQVTGSWIATAQDERPPEVPFNPVAIATMLADVAKQLEGWKSLLKKLEVPFETIDYEDTVADSARQVSRVLRAVGVAEESIPSEVRSRFIKQSADDGEMATKFRRYLGKAATTS